MDAMTQVCLHVTMSTLGYDDCFAEQYWSTCVSYITHSKCSKHCHTTVQGLTACCAAQIVSKLLLSAITEVCFYITMKHAV